MAAEIRGLAVTAAAPHVPFTSRIYGLGSVFGKTLRDARVGVVVVAALLGGIVMIGGATMASTYGTPETRLELATLSRSMPPVLTGLYGNPVGVDTLGGFLSWHYGAYFALLAGLWSILALSSTLAGEARRGSLDFAVATPRARRSIALEKVAGHVVALGVAMAILALAAWATGAAFAKMPGDPIAPDAAIAFAVGLGLKALIAGSIAFALAPLLGRGAAAGIAGALMLASYVIQSYRAVVPAFDSAAGASWLSWSSGHIPLAGQTDWPAVALIGLVSAALLAIGIEAFARRDVGVTIAVPAPAMPRWILGVRGPLGRSFGDLLPTALAWGIGLGLYGLVMATSSRAMADAITSSEGLAETVRAMVPGIDMTTTAGFLQLAFTEIGFILVGLAAATLVASRSSDETVGRLELQLATPLTRARWAVASTLAAWLAIAVFTALLGAAIAVGVAAAGEDPVAPVLGTLVLALYGCALTGIGVAVAGVTRASLAAPVVLAFAIGTFLVDLLAPALRLPGWVGQLALTAHLGEPMVGTWDPVGVAACLAIAIGGLVIGAWGMARRDIGG
jgi:ABC-2 type transport system permease protein